MSSTMARGATAGERQSLLNRSPDDASSSSSPSSSRWTLPTMAGIVVATGVLVAVVATSSTSTSAKLAEDANHASNDDDTGELGYVS